MKFRLVAVACAMLGMASFAWAEDKDSIQLDKAPAAVQASIKKLIGDAKLEALSKETEDGKVIYEIEFELNGADHSATIAEDGKVLEEEAEITEADLPKAVSEAIKAKFPAGKLDEIEKVTADGKTMYEATVKVGEDEYKVKADADGKILSADKEEQEKDEGKDEKKEAKHDEKK